MAATFDDDYGEVDAPIGMRAVAAVEARKRPDTTDMRPKRGKRARDQAPVGRPTVQDQGMQTDWRSESDVTSSTSASSSKKTSSKKSFSSSNVSKKSTSWSSAKKSKDKKRGKRQSPSTTTPSSTSSTSSTSTSSTSTPSSLSRAHFHETKEQKEMKHIKATMIGSAEKPKISGALRDCMRGRTQPLWTSQLKTFLHSSERCFIARSHMTSGFRFKTKSSKTKGKIFAALSHLAKFFIEKLVCDPANEYVDFPPDVVESPPSCEWLIQRLQNSRMYGPRMKRKAVVQAVLQYKPTQQLSRRQKRFRKRNVQQPAPKPPRTTIVPRRQPIAAQHQARHQ